MNNYAVRSSLTELIDKPDIPFSDWAVCLKELDTINTLLGGHAITLQGVKELSRSPQPQFTVAEIGCGGGDNLKAIYNWSRKQNLSIRFIGIDLNDACIEFAKVNCKEIPDAEFISSDYALVQFNNDMPDIIFSSLFCHHFSNQQLVSMLKWLRQNTKRGFFINDLQRHPFAFHSIKWLTRLFSRSYLVRNDAPISVMRGFSRREWQELLQQAGITRYSIQWKWAFRFLIIVKNDN